MKKALIALAVVVFLGIVFLIAWNLLARSKTRPTASTSGTTTALSSTSPSPTSTIDVWGEYHVSLPDGLMLVDSQDRRTGKDPITGTLYHEIPGTSYEEIGSPETHGAGELLTSNLPSGRYTLYVLGGATTSYWLDASHYGQQHQLFRGAIQAGSMIAYVQNYDVNHVASSTFSYAGATSSTVSITSIPPSNLPPPAVP